MKKFALIYLSAIILLVSFGCDDDNNSPYNLILENAEYTTKLDSNGITTYIVGDSLFTGTFRSTLNDTTIEDFQVYKGYLRHRNATYEDGSRQYELTFYREKPDRRHIYYYRNGNKKSYENYRNGKKHATQYYWDVKGNVTKQEEYKNGKLQGDAKQ